MAYEQAKVYFDGGHYIAIPKENFCRNGNNKSVVKSKGEQNSPKQRFEQAFEESKELPKKERKEYIQGVMQDCFANSQETADFVQKELERKRTNSNKRKTRLYRKVYLQVWNFFVTIPTHTLKDLRTTFYTRCEMFGVAESARDEMVGHSGGKLKKTYTDLPDEYLLEEAKKLVW